MQAGRDSRRCCVVENPLFVHENLRQLRQLRRFDFVVGSWEDELDIKPLNAPGAARNKAA